MSWVGQIRQHNDFSEPLHIWSKNDAKRERNPKNWEEKKQPKKTWRFVIYAVNKRTVSDMIFFFLIRIMFIPLPA